MANASPVGEGWSPVLSKGAYGVYDVGGAAFAKALADSPSKILRRDCASCEDVAMREIFYKRLTPVGTFDLLGCIKSNWTDTPGNTFHVDFELYSSLGDALEGNASKSAWTFCNFDDAKLQNVGVGFARDCGPRGGEALGMQWNSWTRDGGQPNVRFAVSTAAAPSPARACPPGQELDILTMTGDNGGCDCDSYCATDWGGESAHLRPSWKGARCLSASTSEGAASCSSLLTGNLRCQCVQASSFCPKNNSHLRPCDPLSQCPHGLPAPMPNCIQMHTNCTGSSSALAPAECDAWIDLFESLGGDSWKLCSSAKLDPCSCSQTPCNADRTHIVSLQM
jgi:hypothetical protein